VARRPQAQDFGFSRLQTMAVNPPGRATGRQIIRTPRNMVRK
jgi:hypothetical protein